MCSGEKKKERESKRERSCPPTHTVKSGQRVIIWSGECQRESKLCVCWQLPTQVNSHL